MPEDLRWLQRAAGAGSQELQILCHRGQSARIEIERLASKATGYPIAKISAKLAVGLTLDEILNPVTQSSYACFEPAIDYVVSKFARFPFDKFPAADRHLGTQMSDRRGHVIGRTFEESF